MAPIKHSQDRKVEFLDIRRDKKEQSLLQAISDGLNPQQNNAKSLPTLLLYDGQCRFVVGMNRTKRYFQSKA